MSHRNILIVDDDKKWCDFFQRHLEADGYNIKIVNNFDVALEEIRNNYYPVVVLDVRLANDNDHLGIELVNEINNLWAIGKVCKILVSGKTLESEEIELITRKSQDQLVYFLSKGGEDGKGFDMPKLKSIIYLAFLNLGSRVKCFLNNKICNEDIIPVKNQVFVAMPYSLNIEGIQINMDEIFDDGIKKPLTKKGYNIIRADKIPFNGALICNVCKGIQQSSFCIADITNKNPNVFFELGMMYGFGKTTVIIKRAGSFMPRDLEFALYIEYDGYNSLKKELVKLFKGLK